MAAAVGFQPLIRFFFCNRVSLRPGAADRMDHQIGKRAVGGGVRQQAVFRQRRRGEQGRLRDTLVIRPVDQVQRPVRVFDQRGMAAAQP